MAARMIMLAVVSAWIGLAQAIQLRGGGLEKVAIGAHKGCKKRLPGAGLGKIIPFNSIEKDGFMLTGCFKDSMFYSGDKFGKHRHMYELKSKANVSIVDYQALVKKEDRQRMSPNVCFDFCRTVPGMLSFGLIHGRDCYCAPFSQQVAGDSSSCDIFCEGDSGKVCGGASKSSIYTMHMCDTGDEKLSAAIDKATAAKDVLLLQAGRLEHLANYMQERASVLQKKVGIMGNPQASALMQDAKVWAGEVLAGAKKGASSASAISSKIKEASALGVGETDYAAATAADDTVRDLDALVGKANTEFAALMQLQDLISPRAAPIKLPTYWKVMNYIDKGRMNAPATCGGTSVGKPIVGKSYAECAGACDELMGGCIGFTFFPSKLCFLFKEITEVNYFTGCKEEETITGAETSPIETNPSRILCSVKFSEFVGSEGLVASARDACPVFEDEGMKWVADSTHITNDAFSQGTLIIDAPGRYFLEEDVVFDPQTTLSSGVSELDVSFPDPTSEKYPQLGGFYLGFFAAISIKADNVTLDCKGHSIEMSKYFHKRQRYFSDIELGSRPFIGGAGPPQFGNSFLTSADFVSANNVRIENCKFGLSSHHAIHGNGNQGVFLKNLEIKDFEVGGIALNGASDVHIEDVQIGSSLKKTFHAQLSQAIFIDHLMNTLIPTQPLLKAERHHALITLRGQEQTVDEVFMKLHRDLNTYYASTDGPLANVFGDGQQLPDGSAIYGILIHKTGPAVGDFGACPLAKAKEDGLMVKNVNITKTTIGDLTVDVFQMTRLMINDKQVMGPAGDVFDWEAATEDGKYIGNGLTDAQLAVGAFKKHLSGHPGVDQESLTYYFGATNIPDAVLDWAAKDGAKWSGGSFKCNGDAMSHVNKGAVGLFLNHIAEGTGTFKDVKISELTNEGHVNARANVCVQDEYRGADSRGVAVVNSPNLMLNSDVTIGQPGVSSSTGTAHDFDTMTTFF